METCKCPHCGTKNSVEVYTYNYCEEGDEYFIKRCNSCKQYVHMQEILDKSGYLIK
jgi:hypothetical protein